LKHFITRLAAVGLCVGAALAAAPAAQAACYGSTPATTSFADSPLDGDGGLAPEISTVTATVDVTCDLAVNPGVDQLIGDDSVFIYIDRDGNPATGSTLFGGADIVVGTLGEIGTDSPPLLGVWDGTQFQFTDPTPVGASLLIGGFSATLDRLGVPSGVVTHYFVASQWQGLYDDYFDWAPNIGSGLTIGLPVSYSTVPPPPPPPPPAPIAPAPAPVTPVVTAPAHKTTGCTVPRVKDRTAAAARNRILGSGCRYRSGATRRYSAGVRRGRAIGTIPSAGSLTGGRVRLVVSRGRRPRHAHTSAAGAGAATAVLAQLQQLANAPLR
jgi:hypothetical protein